DRPARAARLDEAVAIVGAGLLAPQANDVESFWRNVIDRVDAYGDLPSSRFDPERIVEDGADLAPLLKSRLGGVVNRPPFGPSHFSIPPASVRELDPAVILALLSSEQALIDAGFQPGKWDSHRVLVVVGQLAVRAMEAEAEARVLFAEYLRDAD